MQTWTRLIDEYATWLRAAGRAPRTINTYRVYLDRFANTAPAPADTTVRDLVAFLATDRWSAEARKSARTALRGLTKWAYLEGQLRHDLGERLPGVRVPTGVPKPASDDAIAAALAGADEATRLMILLGRYAGLRAAEIAAVHERDYDPAAGILYVTGKGGRTRFVPILQGELAARLAAVRGWAFPSPARPGHMLPGSISARLSRTLPGGFTAHALRHRYATDAYSGSRDIAAVGRLLGHSKPETTLRYVLIGADALRDAAAAASAARPWGGLGLRAA